MVDSPEIAEKISQALDTAAECSAAGTAESYSRLREQLGDLESAAGQSLRSHTAYQFLVTKLQQDSPLTTDDLKTLRSLIIGDADDYLKYDDDFERSKTELARILDQIRLLQSSKLGPESLMQLRVLCHEAATAVAPTVHYLEQKERVRSFEEHTRGPLSDDARQMLASIIKDMAS